MVAIAGRAAIPGGSWAHERAGLRMEVGEGAPTAYAFMTPMSSARTLGPSASSASATVGVLSSRSTS